jgi:hypothetical protein
VPYSTVTLGSVAHLAMRCATVEHHLMRHSVKGPE